MQPIKGRGLRGNSPEGSGSGRWGGGGGGPVGRPLENGGPVLFDEVERIVTGWCKNRQNVHPTFDQAGARVLAWNLGGHVRVTAWAMLGLRRLHGSMTVVHGVGGRHIGMCRLCLLASHLNRRPRRRNRRQR